MPKGFERISFFSWSSQMSSHFRKDTCLRLANEPLNHLLGNNRKPLLKTESWQRLKKKKTQRKRILLKAHRRPETAQRVDGPCIFPSFHSNSSENKAMCLREVEAKKRREKVLLKYKFRVIWVEWGRDDFSQRRGWRTHTFHKQSGGVRRNKNAKGVTRKIFARRSIFMYNSVRCWWGEIRRWALIRSRRRRECVERLPHETFFLQSEFRIKNCSETLFSRQHTAWYKTLEN